MNYVINEVQEIKRRFNFEIDKLLDELSCQNQRLVEASKKIEDKITTKEKLVTIKRLVEIYPSFKVGAIRSMIFSNKWDFNGHCTFRAGRKILIDVDKFEEWVKKPKHPHEAYAHLGRR